MRRFILALILFALPAWAAAPTYVGVSIGIAADAGTSIDIAYPSLTGDDILIIVVGASAGTETFNAISGWTGPLDTTSEPGDWTCAWYWKRAVGDESGTQTATRTSSTGTMYGVMSSWRGCITTETPYEKNTANTADSGTASSNSITPDTDNARIVCFINVEDNQSIGTLTGGNYAEDYELTSSAGQDAQMACDSYGQTTATTEGAQTSALGGTDSWVTFTMALKSEAGPEGRRRSNTSG